MTLFGSILGYTSIAVLAKAGFAYSIEDESKLQTDLLSGYNVNVRPTDRVNVGCSLAIRNILSLDIVEQRLAVTGSLAVVWNDYRLSWNESQHGNVSNVYYRSDQIWRPTLVLQNSVTGIEVIGDDGNQKSIPMSVSSIGVVFWLAPAYFISHCSVDISKFPFDTQTCELVISGWMYLTSSMKFLDLMDEISLDKCEENGEYDIVRTYTRIDSYPLYSSSVELVIFGIELRRKYSYYLVNVVLPVFFMQLLGLVVFVVPTESGEKLTFSLTLLLSLTVMMTLVSEKIPTTSLQIPTLSIYMLGGTVISSLELLMTVIILQFKYYDKERTHVTRRMQTFAQYLAFFTCTKRNKVDSQLDTKSTNNCGLIIVKEVPAEDKCEKDVPEVEGINENDAAVTCLYTYEDIAMMMDKFAIFLFSVVTLMFTISMLAMIL